LIVAALDGSSGIGPERPCRWALRLDLSLPAAVLGPVLRWALARLALICLSVAIEFLDFY
jgi:hypothetical protein